MGGREGGEWWWLWWIGMGEESVIQEFANQRTRYVEVLRRAQTHRSFRFLTKAASFV